jgi:hypothetical protein
MKRDVGRVAIEADFSAEIELQSLRRCPSAGKAGKPRSSCAERVPVPSRGELHSGSESGRRWQVQANDGAIGQMPPGSIRIYRRLDAARDRQAESSR